MAGRAHLCADEPVHPVQPALTGGVVQRLLDSLPGVAVSEVQLEQLAVLRRHGDVPLLGRTVHHDVPLFSGQLRVRHVGADPELGDDLRHHRQPEHGPRGNGTIRDGEGGIGNQSFLVDLPDDSGSRAVRARAVGVEGERLRARRVERDVAHRAGQVEVEGDVDRLLLAVAVRAAVRTEPGVQQAQDVQQFGRGAERAAHSGNPGALP